VSARIATPTAEVVGLLAEHWTTAAVHEAGHAVVALTEGQEVKRVSLWHVKHTSWLRPQEWSVSGLTEVDPQDAETGLLVAVAGVEAECLHTGAPVRRARAANPSDLRMVDDYARRTDLTEKRARDRVRNLLADYWPAVETVAGALAVTGSLSGRDLRRVLR